jgi:gliding motility-associated-like protein
MGGVLKIFILVVVLCVQVDELRSQGYNFVGDSSPLGEDCYVITPAQPWQNGAIWYNEAINISEPFSLQFTANFGTLDAAGADGMVFVMQTLGNDVIGIDGGGMGFEGFEPSFGVEFDTFQNWDFADPPFDHLAIIKDGNVIHNNPDNLAGPVPISSTSDNVEDGQDYIIDITWDPGTSQFTVAVNCEVRLSIQVSLEFFVFSSNAEVFWGFTGATGGEWNLQTVCLDPYILGLPETFATCANEPVQLEAPAASLGTVSWEPAQFLDDPNSFSPVATVDQTTVFTLTYEDLCGNQQVEQTTVEVLVPSIDLGEDIAACESYEIIPTGNFDSITWSDGSQEPTLTAQETGTYWADALLGNCLVSDTLDLVVDSSPEYTGETEVNLCEGEEFVFDLQNPNADILWFDGSDQTTRTFTESGSYEFQLISGVCAPEFTIEVNVTDDPNFDLGPDVSDCGDGDVVITPTGSFEEILWSDGSASNTLQVSESGIYWADIVQGNCEVSDTIEVFLDSPPVYSENTDIDLCEGEEYTFDGSGLNASIIWFDGSEEEVRVFSDPGTYGFELIDGECNSSYELNVDVTEIPEFSLGEDFNLCEGTETLLVVSDVDGDVSWSDGSSGSSLEVSDGGLYWAQVDNNGCSFSDTVVVTQISAPDLSIAGSEALCPGESGELVAQSTGSITWSTGQSGAEIAISSPGLYTAMASDENGCFTEESFLVTALALPFIRTFGDEVKCVGEDLILLAESSNDSNLLWSTGEEGNRIIISEPGDYSVVLTNQCGTTTKNISITEEECFNTFFIPNAFSPDGNGINDIFKVVIGEVERFELIIFNRYGEMVFETQNPQQGWNGSFLNNGYFCPAGVYVLKYIIDFGNETVIEEFGSVNLIR